VSFSRRQFLPALSAAPLGAFQRHGGTRPNFVILYTDDQRFDTIRALGNSAIQTPHMDRLVRNGTTFTHACIMGGTQGAVCVASRAMLLTGQSLFRSARNTGALPAGKDNPSDFHLFPEVLGRNGYRTFATGKWHNGPKLFQRSFQSGANLFFGGMGDQLQMPVQDYDATGAYPKDRTRPSGKFASELFADSAIRFIESQAQRKDPFLCYCAFTSPHDPRMAPQRFVDFYSPERLPVPPNFLPEHPFDNGELRVRDEMLAPFPRTKRVVQEHLAAYYAMVSEVDAQIGRILDAVERSPAAANTYVIFAGDNGLALGQHGLFGKQNLYDHSVRVPLVIQGPGVRRNARSDAFVYLYDLFPTLCEAAGIGTPASVEGQSLLAVLRTGRTAQSRPSLFFAYRHLQRAIRTRDWKLIRYTVNGGTRSQLFAIGRDPWEKEDLAARPEQRERVAQMTADLDLAAKGLGDPLA
jgi:arylsulfatase A-like enzyme